MGSYTEFKFKAKLKQDTPENVIDTLERVLVRKDLGNKSELFKSNEVFSPNINHEFFKCERWYMLFLSTNWGGIQGGKMYKENNYWTIDLHTEFKNYDDEIDKFIDWISTYIVGRKKKQYVGYWRHENMDYEINIYIER